MARKKFDDVAKAILHWLTDRGVDVTKFTAKTGGWGLMRLGRLLIFALKETAKLGGTALVEFKDFVGPKLPPKLQKYLKVKPEDLDEDEIDDEDENKKDD